MKLPARFVSLIFGCLLFTPVQASFPIPLPFDRLVDESTTIVKCEVIRMVPLLAEDDEQVSDQSLGQYLGPKCFSLTKVREVWKKHAFDDQDEAADEYDQQDLLTIAHGDGSRGIRGLSHDLTEGRTYILCLKLIQPGLYQLTDGNSVYPVFEGKVPQMGINMRDEDIAKSKPVTVKQFKERILNEIEKGRAVQGRVKE